MPRFRPALPYGAALREGTVAFKTIKSGRGGHGCCWRGEKEILGFAAPGTFRSKRIPLQTRYKLLWPASGAGYRVLIKRGRREPKRGVSISSAQLNAHLYAAIAPVGVDRGRLTCL